MKLETFITNYMTDGSKDKYVKGVMRADYIPYAEKCSDCQRIANVCHYKDIDGVRRFSMNSPARAMMFALVLVQKYTKIDIEFNADTYDELQKCGALGAIVGLIPDAEYQEYNTVMHMVEDDAVMTETNVSLRLDDLKQAIVSFGTSYIDAVMSYGGAAGNDGDILEGTSEGT